MKPAILIIAYNRPQSLQRLLASLKKAEYPGDVPLVISIDGGGSNRASVRRVAESFDWERGRKSIINHEERLGLVKHVFSCGDLGAEFGSFIMLEDDLFVSPMFYHYALQALDAYGRDPRIAGISLNALWFNGYSQHPFVPYLDDSDVFFLQVAWFQGQTYTQEQWERFVRWRNRPHTMGETPEPMHEMFSRFPETDWFPTKTKYLIATDRFYVFPRQSLTVNFGEAGTHFARPTHFFQVPLQTRRRAFRMLSIHDSVAVYDSFQEILPNRLDRLTGRLAHYDYVVDLNGNRSSKNITSEWVLTTKGSRSPLFSYGLRMWPLEANVVENIPGDGISFCRKGDLDMSRLGLARMRKRNFDYFSRYRRLSLRRQLMNRLLDLLDGRPLD